MTYTFRKAVRQNTSVLMALAGPSGGGKTYSALRLARGLVGTTGKLCLIDTEAGRSLHYASRFDFDYLDLKPPFSPMAYQEAIEAAEQAGYHVIIVDSMSHEWAGDGGCQDMHDEAHDKMGGGDNTSILAWRDAKLAHKKMMSRFLQCRSHLIFCLRSEEKIKFSKNDKGKTIIEPAGWMPVCEKNFMYEMTASFLLLDEKPGIGKPIKLQEQHKPFFPSGQHVDELAGKRLSEWASGAEREGGPVESRTAGAVCDVPPVQSHPPSNSEPEPSGIVCDFAAKIDDLQDILTAQRTWDEIVQCQDVTSKQRASLFHRYQDKVKSLK